MIRRRAGIADARAFAAISRSEIERGLPQSWTATRLGRLLARDDTNAYALVEAEPPGSSTGGVPGSSAGIGGLSIASFGDEHAHLVLHAVTPGLRRIGHGGALLEWQVEAAMTAGLGSLALEVRAGNLVARAFYASLGFEETGRAHGYYASGEDAVRLRLAPLRPVARRRHRSGRRPG